MNCGRVFPNECCTNAVPFTNTIKLHIGNIAQTRIDFHWLEDHPNIVFVGNAQNNYHFKFVNMLVL